MYLAYDCAVESVSGENKAVICENLYRKPRSNGFSLCKKSSQNVLDVLELWRHDPDYLKREVGFCAQWCLDNLCKRIYIPDTGIFVNI